MRELPEPVGPHPRWITGGIVAHNDERRIGASIRSLLAQDLPAGTAWGTIWVVASGCTDGTAEVARSLAAEDPRLGLLIQPERHGKAAAIREVLRRAQGESLVLLNSDAVAAHGAVAALLRTAASKPRPFAVMARPVVPSPGPSPWSVTMRWMWEFHHELHLEMLADGRGAHLSDELLLVSLPAFPWIEEGVINDGSYCAVWLREHSGGCWYAPDAHVAIEVPETLGDHLRQRRRIHVGNAQVTSLLGRAPTTALRYFVQHPSRTLGSVRRSVAGPHGLHHLLQVTTMELVAHALSAWDRLPPRRDHVLWSRITTTPPTEPGPPTRRPPSAPADGEFEQRLRVITEIAREFRTGVPLGSFAALLPGTGPAEPDELESLLALRPDLGSVVRRMVYPPSTPPEDDPERAVRGARYGRAAEALVDGPLRRLRPWVRCIGVTGSTAYGEPERGDDLDFFVVTRAGANAAFLAATYVALRIGWIRRRLPTDPEPCFNYVVDERRAAEEFARGRGLLFAREALTARMIEGDQYYRGLLAQTPWLGTELPRLFAERTTDGGDASPGNASLVLRLASALVFVPLAAFLHLVGLRRNARARREGRPSAAFRTLTAPDRIVFQSQRFEQLRARYEESPAPESTKQPTGGASRTLSAR